MQIEMSREADLSREQAERAHPDLNQGPADLQSAALTTELCTQMLTCYVPLLKPKASQAPGLGGKHAVGWMMKRHNQ